MKGFTVIRLQALPVCCMAIALFVIVPPNVQAGLSEAHQQALGGYKKTKDPAQAIKVLEDAGIKGVLDKKPPGMKDAAYIALLNDYGFFLSETSSRYPEALQILRKVVSLAPESDVGHLNLADTYQKQLQETADPLRREELQEVVRAHYLEYALLLRAKGEGIELPPRVHGALGLKAVHQFDPVEPSKYASAVLYRLIMSQDTEVCTHMLTLFNLDILQYGFDRYENPEFQAIQWERQYRNAAGRAIDLAIPVAKFDINNDGKIDFVLKQTTMAHSLDVDNLYIFFDDGIDVSRVFTSEELRNSPGKIFLHSEFYDLQPEPLRKSRELLKSRKIESVVPGPTIIHPFRLHDATYISMRSYYEIQPVEWTHFHIIAKYKGGRLVDREDQRGVTEGVCWFEIVTDKSPKRR